MNTAQNTRFDTRLSAEQKELFQYAADLGGFKTLSEFVIYSVKVQAEKIVRDHEAILRSKKDARVFFDVILNPPQPDKNLKKAVASYNKRIAKK